MPKKRGRQRRKGKVAQSPFDIPFPGTEEEKQKLLDDLKKGPRKLGLTVTPPKKRKKDPRTHA